MATYITLINFTDKGIQTVNDSPGRAQSFTKQISEMGGSVRDVYWTLGANDGVLVFEIEDDAKAAAALLALGRQDNVRTQTMRAFNAGEFDEILKQVT